MEKTLTVLFDGQVFRPVEPPGLEPNTRYEITVRTLATAKNEESVWDVLDRFTGSIEGPGDWSIEHDHYLYGTPKRYPEETE